MPSQEEILDQQKFLGIYRSNLAHYLKQQGLQGGEAYVSPGVVNSIREARDQIRRIKGILRSWNVPVEDQVDDEAASAAPATARPAERPSQTKPRRPRGTPAAFISYHPSDRAWVQAELLPPIEAAGLKIIVDYRDFEIGVPKLVNIERAVAGSRHTLIVMTPEWLASDWNAFQGLLAGSSDPAGLEQKLLPLMLKPCAPPLRIAMIETLDLTNPAERTAQIERLVRTLKKSARA